MTDHLNFFHAGLSFLVTHELDAIRCKEWRMLPGLSSLSDNMGLRLFVLAHVPLLFWIFQGIGNPSFVAGVDIFMMIHLVLHVMFIRHKNNGFKDGMSWALIIGAAVFGALDLLT